MHLCSFKWNSHREVIEHGSFFINLSSVGINFNSDGIEVMFLFRKQYIHIVFYFVLQFSYFINLHMFDSV